MKSKFLDVVEHIEATHGESARNHPFYEFEPWDIDEQRPEWQINLAREYGIDLLSKELVEILGNTPRLFQSGYINSAAMIKVMFAGNQCGKSFVVLEDKIIRLTGEVPLTFEFKKGESTRKLRSISKNNIIRFGRWHKGTGAFLDHNYSAERDNSWDCGYILGSGTYPKSKVVAPGSKIWIVTYKQARDEVWWPTLKGMIPEHLLDRSKGSRLEPGFDSRENIVYLARNTSIHFITYEQGSTRLEAAGNLQEFEGLSEIVFDEEPPDATFYNVALQRVSEITLVTTPYGGLSWTFDEIFLKSRENKDIQIFHCTQFDCPYKTDEEVKRKMKLMKKWEVGARVFGLHTEQSGRPYYEEMFDSVNEKIRTSREVFDSLRILPNFTWNTPRDIARQRDEIITVEAGECDRDAWEVYEHPKPDTAYFMAVDTAEGSEDEAEEQDRHVAHIFRLPVKGEPEWPVQVATLETGLECDQFAPLTLYGAAYYNNCLLAPESVGKSAGIYLLLTRDWPYKYTMVLINDRTKKPTERYGFSTQGSNRTLLFDMVGNLIKECEKLPMFGIRCLRVLQQIAGTIVGKGGRPDHKKRKRNDALMSFAIGLYVFKNSLPLIQDHSMDFAQKEKAAEPFADRRAVERESRPMLGAKDGGMDRRARQMQLYRR